MFIISLLFLSLMISQGFQVENVKIWKPSNNYREKSNQLTVENSGENCGKVEFYKENPAPIFIDHIKTGEIALPVSGNMILLDDAVLDLSASGRQECYHVAKLDFHNYLDPENWESDVASNPAVPDLEKLPCIYDRIKFPNQFFSGISTVGLSRTDTVSGVDFGNETLDGLGFILFRLSAGQRVFYNRGASTELWISRRECYDHTGCTCRHQNSIQCDPEKMKPSNECHSPVQPLGFCRRICGAYTLFEPTSRFSLEKLRQFLQQENDGNDGIYAYASKIEEGKIQIVFSELKYGGKSVEIAEKFYEKLRKRTAEYGIENLEKLRVSGSQNNGNNVWTLIFLSLAFVCVVYATIFYVFEKRGITIDLGFLFNEPLPMTSSYRARFSPSDDDEHGLIFDSQSGVDDSADVIDSDQSQAFDNPLYGSICTGPNIGDKAEEIDEKISFSKISKDVEEKEEDEEKCDNKLITSFFTIKEEE